jgi:hypothetical protein
LARNRKIRFVVGLFDAVSDLRRALEALVGVGLNCERLCVLANDRKLETANDNGAGQLPAIASDGLSQVVMTSMHADATSKLVPAKALCGRQACDQACAIDPELVAGFPSWVVGRQARQLEDQLELGGTLLFVRVADDSEQSKVGRTLLRHARNGVQTHDIVA